MIIGMNMVYDYSAGFGCQDADVDCPIDGMGMRQPTV